MASVKCIAVEQVSPPIAALRGNWAVRLGEYGSQTGVHVGWRLMRRLHPGVLRRAQRLESADPASARPTLLVGPFNEIDALSVCARLIADG
jgi:hypothetical protein